MDFMEPINVYLKEVYPLFLGAITILPTAILTGKGIIEVSKRIMEKQVEKLFKQ